MAYDVDVPVLGDLSVCYDQSLAISHSLVVHVLSGLTTAFIVSAPRDPGTFSPLFLLERCIH